MTGKPRGKKWPPAIERFHSKIRIEGDCWLWTGAVRGPGYGAFCWNGRQGYAHRFSYEHHKGPLPEGAAIMHICDTPLCVNPDHLEVGTQAENLADMYAKGRGRKASGADHGLAVLTPEKALAIYYDRRPNKVIAQDYGVGASTVWNIKVGRAWSHVTGHKAA